VTPPKKRGMFGRLFGGGQATEAAVDGSDVGRPDVGPDAEPAAQASSEFNQSASEAMVDVSPTVSSAPDSEPEIQSKTSWLQRLKTGLSKTSSKLTEGISNVFTKRRLDATTLDDLEDLLLQADLGVATSQRIASILKATRYDKAIAPDEVRSVLAEEVERVLTPVAKPLVLRSDKQPHVILFVGVNGTGKTTTIGKMAAKFRRSGKTVLIAAGDTFRAAAVEQLKVWGERADAEVMSKPTGADAAALAYEALEKARASKVDVLMIDTAGRLQNKTALMDELEKILRVMRKVDPSAPHDVVLVLDATTGQNALNQVEVFKDKAGVTGLVMTKLDGTARGGILVAISARFSLPVHAIGIGEGIDDLEPFDAGEFARAIAFG
jgi:fused signal recognition particle receptor